MTMDLAAAAGLIRSFVMYRMRPFQNRRLRAFYRDLLSPGDLCFDIGAHMGSRSTAMVAAGARVVALEPQPYFYRFLLRFEQSEALTVLDQAAGAKAGRMALHISRRHPTVTSMSRDWIGKVAESRNFKGVAWDEKIEVSVTTLDALIERYGMPRFCKIDVEGMEAEILSGLSAPIEIIAFEYLPETLEIAVACLDRLERLGRYEYALVRGETHRYAHDDWLSAADMRERLRKIATNGKPGDIYARLVGNRRRSRASQTSPGSAPAMLRRP